MRPRHVLHTVKKYDVGCEIVRSVTACSGAIVSPYSNRLSRGLVMRAILIVCFLLALAAAQPVPAADLDLNLRMPGLSLSIGERDRDGRYWDGRQWRDERWWGENCHRYEGHKDFRGHCERRGPGVGRDCPPGQAKKGRC